MKITLRQLKKLGACTGQVNLFKELFGESVTLTEGVVKEHGAKFDTDWLAGEVLTPEQCCAYQAKCAPLDADYQAKRAPLYTTYRAKCAPLYADYEAKRDPLLADYRAKRALALWDSIKGETK